MGLGKHDVGEQGAGMMWAQKATKAWARLSVLAYETCVNDVVRGVMRLTTCQAADPVLARARELIQADDALVVWRVWGRRARRLHSSGHANVGVRRTRG